jgi:hypothetical protein
MCNRWAPQIAITEFVNIWPEFRVLCSEIFECRHRPFLLSTPRKFQPKRKWLLNVLPCDSCCWRGVTKKGACHVNQFVFTPHFRMGVTTISNRVFATKYFHPLMKWFLRSSKYNSGQETSTWSQNTIHTAKGLVKFQGHIARKDDERPT